MAKAYELLSGEEVNVTSKVVGAGTLYLDDMEGWDKVESQFACFERLGDQLVVILFRVVCTPQQKESGTAGRVLKKIKRLAAEKFPNVPADIDITVYRKNKDGTLYSGMHEKEAKRYFSLLGIKQHCTESTKQTYRSPPHNI